MKALTSQAESASRDPPAAEKIKNKIDEENPVLAKVPGLKKNTWFTTAHILDEKYSKCISLFPYSGKE